MQLNIALAGNPNCGKTTLFNALTGSSQYVGNWPGVTVEKKEGRLKGRKDVVIQDLPGIYSLSPYTLEEVVARNYLVQEKPDAILNIVDGTNIERNLYLTTQLIELGIPVVVAVNMMDLVRKNGDQIDLEKLGAALGCRVVQMSALKGEGGREAAEQAVTLAQSHQAGELPHVFTGSVEHAIAHIEESIASLVEERYLRWYAIKVFERDEKVLERLNLTGELKEHLDAHIADCERELDDDAESIITNQRYAYISAVVGKAVKKKRAAHSMSTSDQIDRIVTNRVLALPIFAAIMFLVYAISMGTSPMALFDGSGEAWGIGIGTLGTDWANDTLFGQIVPDLFNRFLLDAQGNPVVADWLYSLIQDGIVAGVGAVLGFVPQMLVLFLLLSVLEDVGYMARIAFIMDRIFRRFGLSGKSFIPMLVATGCGVPGIMASRTIEQDRDRKMTVMTTGFIPCGAKMPIIGLFAGALFGGSTWVAVSAYFIGVAAVILSGVLLKKTRIFAGDLLASIGGVIAFLFAPLGFGDWQSTVATFTGLIAKENVVSTLSVVLQVGSEAAEDDPALLAAVGLHFSALSAYSFMIFNLLCAPCFAAMGAIKREMNNPKWTLGAIGYMCGFAYAVSLIVYQLGGLALGLVSFGPATVAAVILLAALIYLLVRKNKYADQGAGLRAVAAAAK